MAHILLRLLGNCPSLGRPMSESDGMKELTGLARSIDSLFLGGGDVGESAPADDATDRGELQEMSVAAALEPVHAIAMAPAPDDDEFVPTLLDLAVDAYVAGELERAAEIESLAAECQANNEIDPIARSVVKVVAAAGVPRDASIYAVATCMMSPVVLGRLARRIGSERAEERRREYYAVCREIGDDMAMAIRNDLAGTTDRLSRRIHCEALVEMGDAGRRMIEEMAVDENRFLVQNAVAILGNQGGDNAVGLITSALANPDPRVRREALKSLAKLQAEDSGELVRDLLDDPDQSVKIGAAVAAGELRVRLAVKPLLAMLDANPDPDEVLLLLGALGQLGDPGAVQSIKKHAVRTLFRKPPAEVRIAAYRALHLIGTPHAKQLLKDVVRDKDENVKAAVKEMVYTT